MIRRPLKFTSIDGSLSYTWPRYALEVDSTQPLEASQVQLVGADYDYDLLGDAPARKANGTETVRYLLIGEADAVNAELDTMKATLHRIGRGWFYTAGAAGEAPRRALARLVQMPDIRLTPTDRQRVPVILTFNRSSDYFEPEPIDEHRSEERRVGKECRAGWSTCDGT